MNHLAGVPQIILRVAFPRFSYPYRDLIAQCAESGFIRSIIANVNRRSTLWKFSQQNSGGGAFPWDLVGQNLPHHRPFEHFQGMLQRRNQFQQGGFCGARDRCCRAPIMNRKAQTFVFDSHAWHGGDLPLSSPFGQCENFPRTLADLRVCSFRFRSMKAHVVQGLDPDSRLKIVAAASAYDGNEQ